uniref:Uncharacterized protein n=1 Tax=Acrobeloides nanus TaxID=290746 RepID=A0A914CMM3_9BILA
MKSNLEIKIDSKFDSLGGMLKGEFDNLSGQIKRQSIGFSIFGALFCTTIGILGKIVYDAMQKKRDK